MTAPNLATITASLERSLQNCSLNQTTVVHDGVEEGGAASSDSPEHRLSASNPPTLDLNSDVSLPYHWEQFLDLKTGEIYYINWSTGMKVKEDPRGTTAEAEYSGGGGDDGGEYYSEDEDNSSYESEESSSESSLAASSSTNTREHFRKDQSVLVVAGCKTCLMYFMVPKQVQECPKCSGQLLHFDRSESGSP